MDFSHVAVSVIVIVTSSCCRCVTVLLRTPLAPRIEREIHQPSQPSHILLLLDPWTAMQSRQVSEMPQPFFARSYPSNRFASVQVRCVNERPPTSLARSCLSTSIERFAAPHQHRTIWSVSWSASWKSFSHPRLRVHEDDTDKGQMLWQPIYREWAVLYIHAMHTPRMKSC